MDALINQIETCYRGLPVEFARGLNEIEFRLGHATGSTFNPDIGVMDFDRILKKYIGKYGAPTKQVMLTLVESGHTGLESTRQIRLLSVDSIKAFCITGRPGPDALYYTKKKQSHTFADHPLRVSFGQETPFPATDTLWSMIHFRYAQRFSFQSPDGIVKFDFTVIHAGNGATVHDSGVLNPKSPTEKYEIEVEFSTYLPDRISTEVSALLVEFHGGIAFEPLSQLTRVLNGYIHMCNTCLRVEPSPIKQVSTCLPMLYHGDANTLVKHFCQDLMPDISEILTDTNQLTLSAEDYVVTDKADGRRAFLFTFTGRPYLLYKQTLKKGAQIQSALVITPTGLPHSPLAENSLYDGEFITIDGRPFFLCFDVVISNDFRGVDHPFEHRLRHIAAAISNATAPGGCNATAPGGCNATAPGGGLNICRKTFVPATALNRLHFSPTFERIMEQPQISYPLDGLIFQRLSVPYPSTGEKWEGTIKWKPPGETTMDFKITNGGGRRRVVVSGADIGMPEGGKYWQVALTYGFNLKCRYPGYLLLDGGGVARVRDENAAVDVGDIIECKLVSTGIGPSWTGIRLRRDKRFPNKEMTYHSNMAAIESNISFADLIGLKERVQVLPVVNPMTTVNKYNRRISNQHIYNYASEIPGCKIFEFAVGSAQSASAWKFAHATEIVGIDIIPETRKNVELSDGFFKKSNPDKVKTAYFVADMCTNLRNHTELATVTVKTDLAVCNFAIHYAFRSEASLSTFLKNIQIFLKPGGYFVGTYMASQCIAVLPKQADRIPGFTYEGGPCIRVQTAQPQTVQTQTVWSIARSPDADVEGRSIYGNAITVDIAERPLSHEYYINLDHPDVRAVFRQYGFVYVEESGWIRKPTLFQFKTDRAKLNPFEQRWIDIHRQFVFKYDPDAAVAPVVKKMTFKRKAERA